MNRREVLQGLIAGAAASGVSAAVDAIEVEPHLLLLVLREVLQGLIAGAAASGVSAAVDAIEVEPHPLLLVLRIDSHLTQEQMTAIKRSCDKLRVDDPRLPQIVVLTKGMTLDAVVDPRSRPHPTQLPTWPPCNE